ncbi:hypothetical protein OKT24_19875 [Aeromonas veronii]|nr:hypothetical protein [Aeromonas veronii]
MNDSIIYHKITEIEQFIADGILSTEDMRIISSGPKSWVIRFYTEVNGEEKEVRIKRQRGGERYWSDPRIMIEYCVLSWKISHAKLSIEWERSLNECN